MFSKQSIERLRKAYDNAGLLCDRTEAVMKDYATPRVEDEEVMELTAEDLVDMCEEEREERLIDEKVKTFNFQAILVDWLKESVFMQTVSRHVRKRPDETVGTFAMSYNIANEDVEMLYSPRFAARQQNDELKGTCSHEFYHLILQHLTTRRREPHIVSNMAQDLSINDLVKSYGMKLPSCGLFPGVMPVRTKKGWRQLTSIQRAKQESFEKLIASLPPALPSEVYFEMLIKWGQSNGHKWSDDTYSFDSHDAWENIPNDLKTLVEGKIKKIVAEGVRAADATANGWGNIPAEIRAEIRASVSDVVDWREVLKNFVAMFSSGSRATSIKKINKRYAYVHPGIKRGRTPRLAIAIDQSGSVDDVQLDAIFSVLGSLAKQVSFTIIPFDCEVDKQNIKEWKKGQKLDLFRTRSGGTNFDAPTEYVNSPEHRGQFDGLLICTDGECNAPKQSRVKRGWVITPGQKLLFETNEMVINMDLEKKHAKGAWR